METATRGPTGWPRRIPRTPTDFNKFAINESTGQILTKELLNHEDSGCGYVATDDTLTSTTATTCTYVVKVEVWDGLDGDRNEEDPANVDDTITVNITVSDVVEKPVAPTVTVTSPADWHDPDSDVGRAHEHGAGHHKLPA